MATRDATSDHSPVDRLAEEFLERHRRGECPSLSEYVERYHEWADEIREVFPALLMMEQLKPTPADLTGSVRAGSGSMLMSFTSFPSLTSVQVPGDHQ